MNQEAFLRARRFLQHKAKATFAALASSIGLSFLYVLMLILLGLFADLLVDRGLVYPVSAETKAWATHLVGSEDGPELGRAIDLGDGVGLASLAWRSRESWYAPLVEAPVHGFAWTRSNHSFLIGLLVLMVLVLLARCVLNAGMHFAAAESSIEALSRLRRAVYHQAYRLSTLTFRTIGQKEAAGLYTRHLEAVHEGLYAWMTATFRQPTKFFLLLILAALVESGSSGGFPILTLAFLMFAVLVWMAGGRLSAFIQQQEKRNAHRAGETLALLQESLRIMRLVKGYLMELFNQARVERQLAAYSRSLLRRYRGRAIYRQSLVFLGLLTVAVLAFIAGWSILDGHLGLAAAITLAATLLSMYRPAQGWLEERRVLRKAQDSARALFDFLDRRGDVGQVVGAEFLQPMQRELHFKELTLREPDTDRTLLEGIDLRIAAGERVALVGQEEMEKYGLVYLMPRFLDPSEGLVLIDGKDLRWVTLESLRSQVCLVLQQNLVFNDTIANNIGCGDQSYSLPQIIEAAKVAHAHNFIQRLPNGYDTRIGEMGHELRLSEQFRIALARAILRDPALVVIEEPSTPLDEDAKGIIDDALARFLPGRTAVFLPHRLSTIRNCDRVILLHRGQIAASGSHRELLTTNELYRHLQYLEFNAFDEES